MRICLATPPLISDNPHEPMNVPMGIAYLGAVLEVAGCEVSLIDGSVSGAVSRLSGNRYFIGADPESLAGQILETKPDLVGLSCQFTTRYSHFSECLKALREKAPNLPVVAGGVHPTFSYRKILEQDRPDVVFLGEAEISLLALVKRMEQHGTLDPEGIDGVAWLHNDEIVVTPKLNYIDDLDTLPEPARHLLPMEVYLDRSGGRWASRYKSILAIMTSRSCPGRCSFCCIHGAMGPQWRAHSAKRVLDELEGMVGNWNPSLIGFEDDRLTCDRDRMVEICQGIIDRGLSIHWYTPNGVNLDDLDEELLLLMKKSGCSSLNLAVESGDPDILHRVIGKKGTNAQAVEIADTCRKLGIRTNGYFVIGMPGETDESINNSLQLCLDMKLDGLGLFIATPFPGTRMFDQCVKAGYIDPERFTEEFLESGDPEMLHKPLFDTETMSRERLMWWDKEFTRQFMRQLYRRRPEVRIKQVIKGILNRIPTGIRGK